MSFILRSSSLPSPLSGPQLKLQDAINALQSVPTLPNTLVTALEKLLRVITRLREAGLGTAELVRIDDAVDELYGKVFIQIVENCRGTKIILTDIMSKRFNVLSRDLSSSSATSNSAFPRLKRPNAALLASIAVQLAQDITSSSDLFLVDGPFSLTPIDDGRSRAFLLDRASDHLVPSTTNSLASCPKFRILVVGKTGVGKSSLIKEAFGVDSIAPSHTQAGVSDIETEFISPGNERFILHDSQGYEAGNMDNYEIVQSFINQRKQKGDLRDKLHAVWLCLPTPVTGLRVIETGDENILSMDTPELPVIVVFTKYDKLRVAMQREMRKELPGLSLTELRAPVEDRAQAEFEKLCVGPLCSAVRRSDFPHVKVSIKDKDSMAKLVQLTSERVSDVVQLPWDIAQRANMELNISASVRVGKQSKPTLLVPGQRGLASSLDFHNYSLEDCLGVIHADIVTIWNFNDREDRLNGASFRTDLFELIADLADPNSSSKSFMTTVGGVAGAASAVVAAVPLSAPAVVPVAVAIVFVKWVYDKYKKSAGVLRVMIGYIVDTTLVMQSLFLLLKQREGSLSAAITNEHLKQAVKKYNESDTKKDVHNKILKSVADMNLKAKLDRDVSLEVITGLLMDYRFTEGN